MWAGVLAFTLLLLFLLLDNKACNARRLTNKMGTSKDDRDGTVGAHTRVVDMEYE